MSILEDLMAEQCYSTWVPSLVRADDHSSGKSCKLYTTEKSLHISSLLCDTVLS